MERTGILSRPSQVLEDPTGPGSVPAAQQAKSRGQQDRDSAGPSLSLSLISVSHPRAFIQLFSA